MIGGLKIGEYVKPKKRRLQETVDNDEERERVEDDSRATNSKDVSGEVDVSLNHIRAGTRHVIGAAKSPWRIKFYVADHPASQQSGSALFADIWQTGKTACLAATYSLSFTNGSPIHGDLTLSKRRAYARNILFCPNFPIIDSHSHACAFSASVRVTEHYTPPEPIVVAPGFEETDRSDVVFIIRNKQMFSTKEYLATHSNYFFELFYGVNADLDTDVFRSTELDYDKMAEFLPVILPESKPITAQNVSVVLEMAVKLECPLIVNSCAWMLDKCRETPMYEKLQLADKYKLPKLEDKCLKCLTKVDALDLIAQHAEKMSARLKARIVDQLACLEQSDNDLTTRDADSDVATLNSDSATVASAGRS